MGESRVSGRERIKKLEGDIEGLIRENEELCHKKDGLEKENEELREKGEKLEQEIERFKQEIEQLKQELEKVRRAGKRQAAPFSKGKSKAKAKKPGRKAGAGYGRKGHRKPPTHIDEQVEVLLPDGCPKCGGICKGETWDDQYQTEIIRKVHVTHFRIEVGHCTQCLARVQGRDPRQTSDALGAAASQLGPEALSLAAVLNKELGLPYQKTAAVLDQGFGLKVTRAGLSHALARMGAKCEPTYESLTKDIRSSARVTPDETGWRVGGVLWWLWVAADEQTTVYKIQHGRGYPEAVKLLGANFDGFLVHDGWKPYYQFESATHQSCQRHLITRCDEMIKMASSAGAVFPVTVKDLLLQGLDTRDRFFDGLISEHGLAVATGRLEARLERLLERNYRLPENKRLAKHLNHEFDYLFTYLKNPGLEATNWRGEQAIRPAVVTRKVWGGNRNEHGAHTQEVLMTVLRSARQRKLEPLPLLANLLRSTQPYVLPLPRIPVPI